MNKFLIDLFLLDCINNKKNKQGGLGQALIDIVFAIISIAMYIGVIILGFIILKVSIFG